MKAIEERQLIDTLFSFDFDEFPTEYCLACGDLLEDFNETGLCLDCELETGVEFLATCEEMSLSDLYDPEFDQPFEGEQP